MAHSRWCAVAGGFGVRLLRRVQKGCAGASAFVRRAGSASPTHPGSHSRVRHRREIPDGGRHTPIIQIASVINANCKAIRSRGRAERSRNRCLETGLWIQGRCRVRADGGIDALIGVTSIYSLRAVVSAKDQVISVNAQNITDESDSPSRWREGCCGARLLLSKQDQHLDELRNGGRRSKTILAAFTNKYATPRVEELSMKSRGGRWARMV